MKPNRLRTAIIVFMVVFMVFYAVVLLLMMMNEGEALTWAA